MRITFWGAAQQVTGSMFLIELEDDYRILIDCGSEMGRSEINREGWPEDYKNQVFPFEPTLINTVILTHAHLDHSGELPNLIREGYEGKIFCTPATYDLVHPLLLDSANLNRKRLNALTGGQGGKKKHKPIPRHEIAALYLDKHVEDTMDYFATVPFKQRVKIAKGIWITFIPTGHLLGAANVLLEIEENGSTKRIGFSGDIGRRNYPLLPDPEPFPEVDYLICESTYGNRLHKDHGDGVEILADIIKKTCIDIPGRLIIPAFSVGRTQALLYTLNKVYADKDFPAIKVFTDSPLALKSTKVYEKHTSLLNAEAQQFKKDNTELFDFANLTYVENAKDSKMLSDYNKPCIIISSSGMISGGRVEHHVRMNLSNPYATILFVGYAAEGTMAHDLLNGKKSFEWDRKQYAVSCNLMQTDVFSGHGDLDGLLEFVHYQPKDKLKGLFLVHGDQGSMADFRSTLKADGYPVVEAPIKGQTYILD